MEPHVRCRQCRKLRTANYVLAAYDSHRRTVPLSSALLDPADARLAKRGKTASQFARIGVLSAQQHSDIASSHLRKQELQLEGQKCPDNC